MILKIFDFQKNRRDRRDRKKRENGVYFEYVRAGCSREMVGVWIVGGVILVFGWVVLFGAPYVPSRKREVRKVLVKCGVGKKDLLVDIGCGDGLVLREAARLGVEAVGYEINPLLAGVAWVLSIKQKQMVRVKLADALRVGWPKETTVVYVFGVSNFMPKLEKKIEQHVKKYGRSVKLISYGFELEGRKRGEKCGAYWIYKF